jgi:hypothetical protein
MFNYYKKRLKEIHADTYVKKREVKQEKINCPPIAKEQQISWRTIN